ncbi:uncharacterized protein SPSK_09402 [Sporothrix schenckii 1099-18]|uniref:DNA-binding protein RAP1 n=1 Tax=Sporothrix schenckii 1099-18 TaxID=1397361 RepID=A0A0F2M917_SPOSC|nr:uncharacterized protein SPSK_09402 [Sporothrix schenckii 1099-18]KJR85315.1 hypothetical protein SPSK_09402 [Sporothrix schenckii 1099-18]
MAFSFKGLKFYVSIHTPNETKKIIQNNGGIVVANENDADIRIRDPSRGPPSYRSGDYYSHKWIVDCIKQKRQVDEAPYLIQRQAHPSTTPARPARPARNERTEGERERSPPQREEEDGLVYASARSQSVVKTRNAFTREDDRILQDWVIQKATRAIEEDEYFHDRGNEMYKKLEEKYLSQESKNDHRRNLENRPEKARKFGHKWKTGPIQNVGHRENDRRNHHGNHHKNYHRNHNRNHHRSRHKSHYRNHPKNSDATKHETKHRKTRCLTTVLAGPANCSSWTIQIITFSQRRIRFGKMRSENLEHMQNQQTPSSNIFTQR